MDGVASYIKCVVPGCERPHGSKGYCRAHVERVRRTGSPGSALIGASASSRKGAKWTDPKSGYVYQTLNGLRQGVHRHVMSGFLGRPLLPTETVHHVNGKRSDNRITNLELWTKAQPAGQRVSDMLVFCRAFLAQYEEIETGKSDANVDHP